MKVLVMGGSRFVGLHSVLELEKHGHQVTVFNRGQTALPVEFPRSVDRIYGDRHDLEGMQATFRDLEFDADSTSRLMRLVLRELGVRTS